MRILHILPSCRVGNGAAKLILDLIPHHISKGYKVDVAVLQDVSISYVDEYERLGCIVYILSPQGSNLYNPLFITKLKKIISKYDVVHMHLFPAFYWVVLSKCIFRINCKLVFTEHSTLNNRQKWYLRFIERYIYTKIDKVVSISKAAKECLLNHLRIPLEIKVITNGINLETYSNVPPIEKRLLGVPDDSIIITQVARFAPQKDQMTVLKTLALLPLKYHAVFVGRGELLEEHIRMAHHLNITDRVHFLGVRQDVPSILKVSDVVIMSSNFEGFGLAAVEGMAAGKPVIASEVPGVAEVVKEAGLLFSLHDVDELKNLIISLEDSSFYSEVANRCSSKAKIYGAERTAEQYLGVYHAVTNTY